MAKQKQDLMPDGDYETGKQYVRKTEDQLIEIQSYVDMDSGDEIFIGMVPVLLADQSGNPVGQQQLGFRVDASLPREALDKAPEAAQEALKKLQDKQNSRIVSPGRPPKEVEEKLRSGPPTRQGRRKGKRKGDIIDLGKLK